jgi:hypothetical protein
MIGHPKGTALRDYAERVGTPGDARVAAHLEQCERCRAEVKRIREVSAALREPTDVPPVPNVLEAVLARRAAGDRVIVPEIVALGTPHRRRRAVMAASLAVAAGALAATLLMTPRAVASASELVFLPPAPQQGGEVSVRYRAGAQFADADTLVLRGRFRTADDPDYNRTTAQQVTALLVRGANAEFTGSFRLPASAVLAAFAVEDVAGERVDHNRHRLWHLEVHGADGRPLLAALEKRMIELLDRSRDERLAAARRMALLYADDPRGVRMLRQLEPEVVAQPQRDSVRAAHRAHYAALHQRLAAGPELSAAVIAAMVHHDDPPEVRAYWSGRLQREHPHHPAAVFARQDAAFRTASADPRAYLETVERLWAEIPESARAAHASWIINAFAIARRLGEPHSAIRWTERLLRHRGLDPEATLAYLDALARVPGTADTVIRLLSDRAAAWQEPHDADRPLHSTRTQHRRTMAAHHRAALGRLGSALLAAGDTAAALQSFRTATATGWDPGLFRTAGETLLAVGDTVQAARHFALTTADPVNAGGEDLAFDTTLKIDPSTWLTWLGEARERFLSETLADTVVRPLDRRVVVLDSDGRAHTLGALLEGRITVIVALLPQVEFARWHFPQVEQLRWWLAQRGVNLIVLSGGPGPGSDEVGAMLAATNTSFPVHLDPRGEARDALQQFRWPAYWIVDASGMIVFDRTDLASVRRQVAALLMKERVPAIAAAASTNRMEHD